MFRSSGSSVLPFLIKKASLALRIESRLEKIFSMGINCMSLAVWLEDRKYSAALVGLDLVLGLSPGGGGHLTYVWVQGCRRGFEILTLFRTKIR